MKTNRVLAIISATVLTGSLLVGSVVRAAEPVRAPWGGQILQRVVAELNLSPEQITKIKGELKSERDTLVPLLHQLHVKRKNLRETIQSGGNEAAIRAAHAEVAAIEADLAVERGKLHAKISPLLTEEQIARVKVLEERVDNFVLRALKTLGERLGQ